MKPLPVAAAVVAMLLSSSCFLARNSPETGTVPQPSPVAPPAGADSPLKDLQAENARLREEQRHLEENRRAMELRILEHEARIVEQDQTIRKRNRMLEEAIQEVVRNKAKHRSLESRAEAASEIAEAEIALKDLHESANGESIPEMSEAAQLLRMAGEQFEKENFGGALYLTGQAKSQMNVVRLRLAVQRDLGGRVVGEVRFSAPISLKVSKRTNFREGPGTEHRILFTLEPDTLVTAYSNKGVWMRIKVQDGRSGWVHRSLVTGV